MDIMNGVLANRTLGAYPLSIGTSLSFESIAKGPNPPYDPLRPIPDNVDISKYNRFYVNVATLCRNIVGSLSKEDLILTTAAELAAVMSFEMDTICEIINEHSHGRCTPEFYACTYETQYRKQSQNAVQLRKDKTELQVRATERFNAAMKLVIRDNDYVITADDSIKLEASSTVLLLSHVAYDLLSYKKCRRLDLLESHTGKLKPRQLWYTKYHKVPGYELNTLPFTEKLLKIFGDSVLFVPMDVRFRKLILETSVARKWTPLTTEAKIQADLDATIKERYLYDLYCDI